MILEELIKLYEKWAESGVVAGYGWEIRSIQWMVTIDKDGNIMDLASAGPRDKPGPKWKLEVPHKEKRSSAVIPHFLSDTAKYILGLSEGSKARDLKCYESSRNLHLDLLKDLESEEACALRNFFLNWIPEKASEHPVLGPALSELMEGGYVCFRYGDSLMQDVADIRKAWNDHFTRIEKDKEIICSVTGKADTLASVHPLIRHLKGSVGTGSALVTCNAQSSCSWGAKENENAGVGQYAAFAYASALNRLLDCPETYIHLGDMTVVFWADSGELEYSKLMIRLLSEGSGEGQTDILDVMNRLAKGEYIDEGDTVIKPSMGFHMLGLLPNVSRISICAYEENSFGMFAENLRKHYGRLSIVKPVFVPYERFGLWRMAEESKKAGSSPSPNLYSDLFNAVINDSPYPMELYYGVLNRTITMQNSTWTQASILKACLLKRAEINKCTYEEVLGMSLNPDSRNIPYTLGRLFAVLEQMQQKAMPNIQDTFRSKYFAKAMESPAMAYAPMLISASIYAEKLNEWLFVLFDKKIAALMEILEKEFPAHLNVVDQGIWAIGYYHERQTFYTKKEEKE